MPRGVLGTRETAVEAFYQITFFINARTIE